MSQADGHEVTRLIERAGVGDAAAADALLPMVYDELRRLAAAHLAREPAGHTLQPTALVHEAYLRLLGGGDVVWEGRKPFFCAAATAMRRILVDRARWNHAEKRGGGRRREDVDCASMSIADPTPMPAQEEVDVLKLNDVLTRLERRDERQAEVVLLRYFGGLSVEETARAIGVSEATVKNDWVYAKAWLRRELSLMEES